MSVTPQVPSDMEGALAEIDAKLPGMLSHVEPDSGGIHTTDTVDFDYILSGDVWMELDDGVEVHLSAGDTVIQNGTRHAWRNKGSEPCRMLCALIGAHRVAK
jgi:quercetin dioxygenase-like cupin family protein